MLKKDGVDTGSNGLPTTTIHLQLEIAILPTTRELALVKCHLYAGLAIYSVQKPWECVVLTGYTLHATSARWVWSQRDCLCSHFSVINHTICTIGSESEAMSSVVSLTLAYITWVLVSWNSPLLQQAESILIPWSQQHFKIPWGKMLASPLRCSHG